MQKFFAVKNKNDEDRSNSSSGGVFLSVAKEIINENGVVYGAIYNEDLEVVHYRANSLKEVKKMMGSKYSQSNLKGVLENIKQDLNDGKKVLFVGTPCQVNTIKTFAKNNDDLLTTIDLICHGTPEKKFLKDYILFQEKNYHSKILKINMRYKNKKSFYKNLNKKYVSIYDVQPKYMNLVFENGKEYLGRSDIDPYYQLFDLFINDGCFKCKYASSDRLGDITIGDFHEISSKLGDFNDGNGVSLLIVNTKNGEKILDKIKDELNIIPKKKEDCLQPSLKEPTKKPLIYEQFREDYDKYGFDFIIKKYTQTGFKPKIKKFLYKTGLIDFFKRRFKKNK